ncbi:MAG: DUF3820 family protein [Deltaproteobacteria bacterium]|jgi:uncharacterized protein (DUF3820 family)
MKIPMGKYKGEYVNYLPDDYLRWLYFQDILKPDIEQAGKIPRTFTSRRSCGGYKSVHR